MAKVTEIPPVPSEPTYKAELNQSEVRMIRAALREYKYVDFNHTKPLKTFNIIERLETAFAYD